MPFVSAVEAVSFFNVMVSIFFGETDGVNIHDIGVFLLLEGLFLVEFLLVRVVSVVAAVQGVGASSDGFGL